MTTLAKSAPEITGNISTEIKSITFMIYQEMYGKEQWKQARGKRNHSQSWMFILTKGYKEVIIRD